MSGNPISQSPLMDMFQNSGQFLKEVPKVFLLPDDEEKLKRFGSAVKFVNECFSFKD